MALGSRHRPARARLGQVQTDRRPLHEEDFVFDRDRNVYICPAGAELTHSGIVDQGRILPYRASKNDCSICALKPQCTTAAARKVSRDIDEDVRDQVRALANTEAFQVSRRERKKVEVRFAHMKRIHRLDRLRLRGLSGAKDEVLLTATAQNLQAAREAYLATTAIDRSAVA